MVDQSKNAEISCIGIYSVGVGRPLTFFVFLIRILRGRIYEKFLKKGFTFFFFLLRLATCGILVP